MSIKPRNDTDRAFLSHENSLWRDVYSILDEIDQNTEWVRRLIQNRQIPLTLGDLPTSKWVVMAALFKSLGEIRGVLMEHRPRRKKETKKRKSS